MDYHHWSSHTEQGLATQDIAQLNLATACGLPFAEELNVAKLCAQVDDWAAIVEHATKRMFYKRSRYKHYSDARFRMLVMITVLQRDLGVRYNLAFSQGEYDASDSRNLFLHGLLSGHGGTCVTMPVLYIAIGRRLGYPLWLVNAKEHLFCRWEGDGDRFNIEATAPGFVSHPDEYYHDRPKPLTAAELHGGKFLRNFSRLEEVAKFLAHRGNCCVDNLLTYQAIEAYAAAHKLTPHDRFLEGLAAIAILIARIMDGVDRHQMAHALPRVPPNVSLPDGWARHCLPVAYQNIDRILANRKARLLRTTVPAPWEQAATGVYYA